VSAVRETMSARENLVRSERRIEDWGKTGEYLVVHNQKDSMKYAMVVKKKDGEIFENWRERASARFDLNLARIKNKMDSLVNT
jgi:hypothetical protein